MSEQDASCHRCGAEADGEMGGKPWCASCLHIEGSCCAGDEDETCFDGRVDSAADSS